MSSFYTLKAIKMGSPRNEASEWAVEHNEHYYASTKNSNQCYQTTFL